MDAQQSRDLETPNLCSLNICWLQAHACLPTLVASLLAVSNYSTCMLYLGELELAAKARILVKLVANIQNTFKYIIKYNLSVPP